VAVPASPPQNEITDDGNIIVNPYGMATLRAMGRWKNDRLPLRNPQNQNIEKAPNSGTHAYKKDIQKCAHINLVNAFRLIFAVETCSTPSVVSLSAITVI
jgi:hypothetical protein